MDYVTFCKSVQHNRDIRLQTCLFVLGALILGGGGENRSGFATRGVGGLPKAAVGLPKFGAGLPNVAGLAVQGAC